jgi:hypothetical protein
MRSVKQDENELYRSDRIRIRNAKLGILERFDFDTKEKLAKHLSINNYLMDED